MTRLQPVPDAPSTIEEVRAAAAAFGQTVLAMRQEVGRVLVGQQAVVDECLVALLADGHVLLEGVPGLGKTLLVRTLGQILGLRFSRIQFTPDLMPADITGTQIVVEDAASGNREIQFRAGPIFAQVVLADEINRATPKAQSALLEAMQERSVTVGGRTMHLERPFFVLATQNPIEQEGTYPLPEAQLDRFLLKVRVPAVDQATLNEVLVRTTTGQVPQARQLLDAHAILAAQRLARQVAMAPHVQDYAIRLVLGTHPRGAFSDRWIDRWIAFGASPRAAQALVSCAKVRALLDGRFAVSCDDLRAIAPAALRHRVVPSFEAEADATSVDRIVEHVIGRTPTEVVP
ncbi:MAG: hypothetical protein RJA05_1099 [Planctomycetota bacterium]|jgi:MoxR-like ATPase